MIFLVTREACDNAYPYEQVFCDTMAEAVSVLARMAAEKPPCAEFCYRISAC